MANHPPHQFTATLTKEVALDYLLYEPDDVAAKSSWPLVLFLHGAGERGKDLDLVALHGPPKHVAAGDSFPFFLVSPQCAENAWWQPDELRALLVDLLARLPIDPDRVYVTGLSMGGFGSFGLAGLAPELLAACLPICGGGERSAARAIAAAQLPVWACHGDADPVVPCSESERMVGLIQQFGGDATLTVYPGVDHDSWSQTYADRGWYEWLLQHTRRQA